MDGTGDDFGDIVVVDVALVGVMVIASTTGVAVVVVVGTLGSSIREEEPLED